MKYPTAQCVINLYISNVAMIVRTDFIIIIFGLYCQEKFCDCNAAICDAKSLISGG